jgi:uncharacterized protein with HEPN domain
MIDLGNLVRRAYHTTRADIVWDVIRNELPVLKTFVTGKLSASS